MDDFKIFSLNEKKLETLLQTIRIYGQYIGMKFVIEKCIILIMKKGKTETMEEIEMPNQEIIWILREKENY